MANLQESQNYEAGVYQLETTDPVVAGPEGISNLQAKQLANRTAWLKQQVDTLLADLGDLGIDDVSGLQIALNAKLGLMAKAADSELLDGQDGKIYAPPGAVISFAASSPPAGWIECNGASLSRIVYADLFAAIGTVFGMGNGSTTFNLPDLRGEFIRGFDNGRGVDNGRLFAESQTDGIKQHTHNLSFYNGSSAYSSGGGAFHSSGRNTVSTPSHLTLYGTDTYQTLNDASPETRPRNIALLFCIKY